MILENFKGKKVLITGAAGFIGSNLSAKLVELGADVTGVDNFLTGNKKNVINLINNENKDFGRFRLIEADASLDPSTYLSEKPQFDFVLHFASPASPPRYQDHPVETYQINAFGTHSLLQYILKNSPKAKLVFASTSEVYGDPAIHPQVESYWGNVNPNGVRSCYDEAKRLGETICGVHQRDFGLDVRIVRIFNTYGPNMDPDDGRIIPNFVKQSLQDIPLTIYGDGSQTRSYCFVDDLVKGILLMAITDGLSGETINLGNSNERTVLETAEFIQKVANPNNSNNEFDFKPLPKDDPTRRKPDISKAKELLGWEPKIGFEEGLKKTVEYFNLLNLN